MSADVTRWYDEFAFHKIYHRINDFCVVELSAFYFDVLKDRLYISAPNSQARRAAQTAIWRIGEALVRLPGVGVATHEQVCARVDRPAHEAGGEGRCEISWIRKQSLG